jgi:hypothetical protein
MILNWPTVLESLGSGVLEYWSVGVMEKAFTEHIRVVTIFSIPTLNLFLFAHFHRANDHVATGSKPWLIILIPIFTHHSIAPPLHHFSTPILHYSTTPSLQYSNTPKLFNFHPPSAFWTSWTMSITSSGSLFRRT